MINNKINLYEKQMNISDSMEKHFTESYDKLILSLMNTTNNNNHNINISYYNTIQI